jgi:ssDNA-binding Zn-finger/Zn-ribbon topoisomerase 1
MVTAPVTTHANGYHVGDPCPQCGDGKLVKRKGKSEFLGCSNYHTKHCKFTDYREAKLQA